MDDYEKLASDVRTFYIHYLFANFYCIAQVNFIPACFSSCFIYLFICSSVAGTGGTCALQIPKHHIDWTELYFNLSILLIISDNVIDLSTHFQLLHWIGVTRPWLEDRTGEGTPESTQRNVDRFRDYRRSQKPERLDERARLETAFNNLQTRLRLSNRPAFVPSDGKLVSVRVAL